jgi:hypothetical protein
VCVCVCSQMFRQTQTSRGGVIGYLAATSNGSRKIHVSAARRDSKAGKSDALKKWRIVVQHVFHGMQGTLREPRISSRLATSARVKKISFTTAGACTEGACEETHLSMAGFLLWKVRGREKKCPCACACARAGVRVCVRVRERACVCAHSCSGRAPTSTRRRYVKK